MGNQLQRANEANQPEENEPQQEVLNFTCEICIEPTLANRKFNNGTLCSHCFCLDCISKYIQVQVEGKTGTIRCPGFSCKLHLDPLSCRSIIPKPLFDKWCDLLCDPTVLGLDRCYCPYRDCSVLVVNECDDKLKKTKCPNCKRDFCFRCKIPWHSGYKCSESGQLRDANDILMGELIERNKWTRCYKCGHSVERVSGCRNIICKCGAQFCHQCGRRSHLGPCKLKCCCGNRYVFILLYLVILAALFDFLRSLFSLLGPTA